MKITFSLCWILLVSNVSLFAQNSAKEAVTKAEAHIQAGQYKEAIKYCTEQIEANSELHYCYGLRGIAYYHETKTDRAYEDLTIAIQHFPTEKFYYYRSRSRNKTNYKGIVDDLSEAISINPNNPRYFYQRGQVQWKAFIETALKHDNYKLNFIEEKLGFSPDPCTDLEQATALSKEYAKTLKTCTKFQLLAK